MKYPKNLRRLAERDDDRHYCESSLRAVGLVRRDEELGARRAINPAGGRAWKLNAIVFRKALPGLRRHLGGTLVGKEALAEATGAGVHDPGTAVLGS